MKKRLLALFLLLLTTSSLVACNDGSKKEAPPDVPYYDKKVDHKVILTDNTKGSLVALDLDDLNRNWMHLDWKKRGNDFKELWSVDLKNDDLCGVKYRYSSFYGTHVVLATASTGQAYAIDYRSKQVLWSVNDCSYDKDVISLYNAHSIEMLPNGDIIVATSGYGEGDARYKNGGLHYYPAGSNTRSEFLSLPFAHAVLWDPTNKCLWAIGYEGVVAVKITGEGEGAFMTKIPEMSYEMSYFSGHDMVPAFGMKGKYWISDSSNVYLYDTATKEMTRHDTYSMASVKGIAYFEDGTFIASTWGDLLTIFVTAPEYDYKPRINISYISTKIYKIHTMTAQYE